MTTTKHLKMYVYVDNMGTCPRISLLLFFRHQDMVVVNADLIYYFLIFILIFLSWSSFPCPISNVWAHIHAFSSCLYCFICRVSGTGGNALVGEIPLLRLFNSWKESLRSNGRERAVMLTTVDLNPRALKVFLSLLNTELPCPLKWFNVIGLELKDVVCGTFLPYNF